MLDFRAGNVHKVMVASYETLRKFTDTLGGQRKEAHLTIPLKIILCSITFSTHACMDFYKSCNLKQEKQAPVHACGHSDYSLLGIQGPFAALTIS